TLLDPPAIALPAAQLDEYAGTYELTEAIRYTIRRDGDRLIGERTGRPAQELRVEARDVLFVPGQPRSRKIFQRDAGGRVTGFAGRRGGGGGVWPPPAVAGSRSARRYEPARQPSVNSSAARVQLAALTIQRSSRCASRSARIRARVALSTATPRAVSSTITAAALPSARPSALPSARLSALPSARPSALPSARPSALPSARPSALPSARPSALPSARPSALPSARPSALPSARPSALPSARFSTSTGLSLASRARATASS